MLINSSLKDKINDSLSEILKSELGQYCDKEFSFEALIIITIDSKNILKYNLQEKFVATNENKPIVLKEITDTKTLLFNEKCNSEYDISLRVSSERDNQSDRRTATSRPISSRYAGEIDEDPSEDIFLTISDGLSTSTGATTSADRAGGGNTQEQGTTLTIGAAAASSRYQDVDRLRTTQDAPVYINSPTTQDHIMNGIKKKRIVKIGTRNMTLCDKLTILELIKSGIRQTEIAKNYSVSRATITNIKRQKDRIIAFTKAKGFGDTLARKNVLFRDMSKSLCQSTLVDPIEVNTDIEEDEGGGGGEGRETEFEESLFKFKIKKEQ